MWRRKDSGGKGLVCQRIIIITKLTAVTKYRPLHQGDKEYPVMLLSLLTLHIHMLELQNLAQVWFELLSCGRLECTEQIGLHVSPLVSENRTSISTKLTHITLNAWAWTSFLEGVSVSWVPPVPGMGPSLWKLGQRDWDINGWGREPSSSLSWLRNGMNPDDCMNLPFPLGAPGGRDRKRFMQGETPIRLSLCWFLQTPCEVKESFAHFWASWYEFVSSPPKEVHVTWRNFLFG